MGKAQQPRRKEFPGIGITIFGDLSVLDLVIGNLFGIIKEGVETFADEEVEILNEFGLWRMEIRKFRFTGNLDRTTGFKKHVTSIADGSSIIYNFETQAPYYFELDKAKGLPTLRPLAGKLRAWAVAKGVGRSTITSFRGIPALRIGQGIHPASPYHPAGQGRDITAKLIKEAGFLENRIALEIGRIATEGIEFFAGVLSIASTRQVV